MINTILGYKKTMSHTFIEDTRVPVTWVSAGPCIVTHIKSEDKDGYWAVQLGFGWKKTKNTTKSLQGHLNKSLNSLKDKKVLQEKKHPKFIKEVKLDIKPDVNVGDVVLINDIFRKGDVVAVTGISKGKGFAGVVKRWHFAGGPKTHGQSDRLRAPGSIGQGTTPGRVLKGKKMAGRMGQDTVTVKNLTVVDIDKDLNSIAISGAVPGPISGLLIIKKIKSGSLEDLVEETPQVKVQQEEETDLEENKVSDSEKSKGENNIVVKNEEEAKK